jgi:hypothetical protein
LSIYLLGLCEPTGLKKPNACLKTAVRALLAERPGRGKQRYFTVFNFLTLPNMAGTRMDFLTNVAQLAPDIESILRARIAPCALCIGSSG